MYTGLGDAQGDCVAAKMRDPLPGAVGTPTCTPEEVSAYVAWKAGMDAQEAVYEQSYRVGYMAFAGAAAALLFLPGYSKLVSLPLAWYGLTKEITGGF